MTGRGVLVAAVALVVLVVAVAMHGLVHRLRWWGGGGKPPPFFFPPPPPPPHPNASDVSCTRALAGMGLRARRRA